MAGSARDKPWEHRNRQTLPPRCDGVSQAHERWSPGYGPYGDGTDQTRTVRTWYRYTQRTEAQTDGGEASGRVHGIVQAFVERLRRNARVWSYELGDGCWGWAGSPW